MKSKYPTIQDLALEVTAKEGKKISISIAQVTEVIYIVARLIVKKPLYIAALLRAGAK